MGKFVELVAADQHRFAAYVALPTGELRGGLVVVPEIFGVNSHIRGVADGYAANGYCVVAPCMFDRAQRGYESGYTPDEVQTSLAIMRQMNWDQAVQDIAAAAAHLAPQGKVGVVGYCWGGTLAWLSAARVPGLACAVPYYGGAMPKFVDEEPRCPTLCHFAEKDHSLPMDEAEKIAAAHPTITAHFYPAGHGFNCEQRGAYEPESAKLARERTLAFLRENVG